MSGRGHRFVHLGLGYDDEAVLGEPRSSVPGLVSKLYRSADRQQDHRTIVPVPLRAVTFAAAVDHEASLACGQQARRRHIEADLVIRSKHAPILSRLAVSSYGHRSPGGASGTEDKDPGPLQCA